jgi:hypothetical protein
MSVSPLSAIHRALRLHAALLKIKKPQKAIGLSRASGGAQLAKIYRISFRPSLSLSLWLAAACTTPDLNYACSRDGTFATRFAPRRRIHFSCRFWRLLLPRAKVNTHAAAMEIFS